MKANEFITEAANPAQQAAIAISKKKEQGVAEGEGNFAKAIENLHGWYQRDSSDPDVEIFDFEDGEGGYYAQGNIEHNLKTGEITIDFEDTSGEYGKPEVSGTYNSIGDAMNALRGITTQMRYNSGKKPNFDTLGGRSIAGSNDVYKTDKAGKKGTLGKARMDTMKASSPYRMRGGPKGKLPEGEVIPLGKKHRGDLEATHSCPKCGGELEGGKYMGHRVKVCQPCKQVYLPPNSGIDQQGNKVEEGENWSKHNNKRVGGMSKKSVKSYRRSHPGSKIQTAVTTKPSKIKKGSKDASRRKSFCARMSGMKKAHASAKTKRDPDSPINKALRRWNCESIEQMQELVMIAEQMVRKAKL